MLCLVSTLVDLISAMSVNVPPPVEDEEQAPGRKHASGPSLIMEFTQKLKDFASRTQRHQKSQELTLLPGTDASLHVLTSRHHLAEPTC